MVNFCSEWQLDVLVMDKWIAKWSQTNTFAVTPPPLNPKSSQILCSGMGATNFILSPLQISANKLKRVHLGPDHQECENTMI